MLRRMKITKRNESRTLPALQEDWLERVFPLREAMARFFDENAWSPLGLIESTLRPRELALITPRVDVSETDREVKVRVDVPGIDPKDVSIEVTENSLALSGTVDRSEEEKRENYYRMERQFGQFSREFLLPSKIDPDSVEATAKNGVITITLKKQESEQKRKVSVKAE